MALLLAGTIGATLLGAIIGSFLNVVVYRLPRDMSISNPRWSMCPECGTRILPYDNIPLLGWLMLRGRCRACRQSISSVYPLVEGLTALAFLAVWDAFFVGQINGPWSEVARDWPLLVAAWTLVAALMAVSVMDIDAYMLDVRPLWLTMIVGVIAWAIWFAIRGAELIPQFFSYAPAGGGRIADGETLGGLAPLPPSLCLIGAAMGLVWGVTELVLTLLSGRNENVTHEDQNSETVEDTAPVATAGLDSPTLFQPIPIVLLAAGLILLTALVALDGMSDSDSATWYFRAIPRGLAICVILMAAVVLASMTHRPVDDEIVEEIEAERAAARSMALHEFAVLMPALFVGAALFAYLKSIDALAQPLSELPLIGMLSGTGLHLGGGLLYGVSAAIGGAAVGWSVRIGGTLLFGKEAFGSGDIYILAAIGAGLGFWTAFFSLFLGVLLALMGVALSAFSKTSRAIPFGPWLALGGLTYLWLAPELLAYFQPAVTALWEMTTGRFP